MTYATETGGAVCNNGYHIMSINVEIIDTIKVAYNYSSFVGLHCVSKNVHLFYFLNNICRKLTDFNNF